jgi:hypothetical protein
VSGALSKYEMPSADMKNEAKEVYTGNFAGHRET